MVRRQKGIGLASLWTKNISVPSFSHTTIGSAQSRRLTAITAEPPSVTHLICDRGDGKYARYQPTVAGAYNITLQYQDDIGQYAEFKVSPRTTRNAGRPPPNGHLNSWAFGVGLTKGISRKPALFTIQARDRFNNNATSGGAVFTVFITGKSTSTVLSEERLAYNRALRRFTTRAAVL